MTYKEDFTLASSGQIEVALCRRLEQIRLARNITQLQLANEAGLSLRTIGRLENGQGVSLDTFLRVLIELGVQQNLERLLPDPTVRPVERMGVSGRERRRARPSQSASESPKWTWGDDKNRDD